MVKNEPPAITYFRLDDLGVHFLQTFEEVSANQAPHFGDHIPASSSEHYDWMIRAAHIGELTGQDFEARRDFEAHIRFLHSQPQYVAERGRFIIPHLSKTVIDFVLSRWISFAAMFLKEYKRYGIVELVWCEICHQWVHAIDPELGMCSTCLYEPVLGRPDHTRHSSGVDPT